MASLKFYHFIPFPKKSIYDNIVSVKRNTDVNKMEKKTCQMLTFGVASCNVFTIRLFIVRC